MDPDVSEPSAKGTNPAATAAPEPLEEPPDQRVVLVLSDVQGMSYEEIGEITSANLGTVKSRIM